MASTCVRPGCGAPASATLTYDYGARIVWLDDLGGDRHPWVWGMCPAHADGLRVPEGWIREDRRRGPDRPDWTDQPWADPGEPARHAEPAFQAEPTEPGF